MKEPTRKREVYFKEISSTTNPSRQGIPGLQRLSESMLISLKGSYYIIILELYSQQSVFPSKSLIPSVMEHTDLMGLFISYEENEVL